MTENSSNRYHGAVGATAPTGPVTVTATSDHLTLVVDNDTSPLERTLTFSTSTWDTAQTMTARALDDADGGDETAIIAHVAMGGDYGGVSVDLSATTTGRRPAWRDAERVDAGGAGGESARRTPCGWTRSPWAAR